MTLGGWMVASVVAPWLAALLVSQGARGRAAVALGRAALFVQPLLLLAAVLAVADLTGGWTEGVAWLPSLGVRFDLRADALSLQVLAAASLAIATGSAPRSRAGVAAALGLQGASATMMLAGDGVLLCIGAQALAIAGAAWIHAGPGPRAAVAARRFLLQASMGAGAMTVLVVYAAVEHHNAEQGLWRFDLEALSGVTIHASDQAFMMWVLSGAIALMMGLAPLHGGYVSASVEREGQHGGWLLAVPAVVAVTGLRLAEQLCPHGLETQSGALFTVALFSAVYAALGSLSRDRVRALPNLAAAHAAVIVAVLLEAPAAGAVLAVTSVVTVAAAAHLTDRPEDGGRHGRTGRRLALAGVVAVPGLASFPALFLAATAGGVTAVLGPICLLAAGLGFVLHHGPELGHHVPDQDVSPHRVRPAVALWVWLGLGFAVGLRPDAVVHQAGATAAAHRDRATTAACIDEAARSRALRAELRGGLRLIHGADCEDAP